MKKKCLIIGLLVMFNSCQKEDIIAIQENSTSLTKINENSESRWAKDLTCSREEDRITLNFLNTANRTIGHVLYRVSFKYKDSWVKLYKRGRIWPSYTAFVKDSRINANTNYYCTVIEAPAIDK